MATAPARGTWENDDEDSGALRAFVDRKIEIDEMLARLTELSGEHFNVSPESVDWGHVGTVGHIRDKLADILEIAEKAF